MFYSRCFFSRLLLFSLCLTGFLPSFASAADPPRRTGEPATTVTSNCRESVRRFVVGPGRRPGATVVPLTLRLQILNEEGEFIEASAGRTKALVIGDDLTFQATVNNLSLYDVGNVVLKHTFTPSRSGPREQGISGVQGAVYNELIKAFVIDLIPSDDSVTFTFHLLLSGNLDAEISQSQILLEDFEVLEAERRFPERTPETPIGRSSQTLERVGIGGTDVACFTWEGNERIVETPVSTSSRSVSSVGTTSGRREPGPPYLFPSGRSLPEPIASVTPVTSLSALVSLEKRASMSEVQPGGSVTYTITVRNRGAETLRNILVDERFSSAQQRSVEAAEGTVVSSGIQWTITTLEPGRSWVGRYRAQVAAVVRPGEEIPSTTTLSGEALLDIPTTQRSASVSVKVLQILPKTGIEMRGIIFAFQVLLGMVISFVLFFLSLSSANIIGKKWLQ